MSKAKKDVPSRANDVREGLLAEGGNPADRGDTRERELTAMALELDALEEDITRVRAAWHATEHARLGGILGPRPPAAPTASVHGESIALTDGTEVLIRPIEPGDASGLQDELKHLSAVSRFRRFRAPVGGYSARELAWLTQVDHQKHEALIAIHPSDARIAGIAQYVCDPQDGRRAHVTYVVDDAWQHRGLGNALIDRLAARALARGIERFSALTLAADNRARQLLARVSDEIHERSNGGLIEITGTLRAAAQSQANEQ